jgi:hypothetical protein
MIITGEQGVVVSKHNMSHTSRLDYEQRQSRVPNFLEVGGVAFRS